MRIDPFKFLISCVICASVFFGVSVQAKMYKWKDENGQVHYGDSIPEQYLDKERKELNAQGAVVRKVDRAKTQEEIDEQKRLDDIAKEQEKELKEQQRQDRVLLDTYTTERDLIIARNARIDAVNSQIKLSESIIENAKQKLVRTEKQIAQIEAKNRAVPKDVYAKLKREQQQLETYNKVADGHKQKLEAIKEQFDGYIARFNELRIAKEQRRQASQEKKKNDQ